MPERRTAIVVIRNKLGLHARAAAKLVEAAARFQSNVQVKKDSDSVDARSILGLMMLGARVGSQIEVSAEGPDAREALAAILAQRSGRCWAAMSVRDHQIFTLNGRAVL